MSEPTLVFPPDSSDPAADPDLPYTSSIPDTEKLRLLLARSGARDDSPAPDPHADAPAAADPNDFSFSFNEEDLIPKKTSWSGNHRNDYYEPVIDPRDLSDSSSTFYSRAPDFPADSKITVQRTLYVSEQQKADSQQSHQHLQPHTLSSGAPRADAQDLDAGQASRSEKKAITNFARKQRPARNNSRSPEKQPVSRIVRPDSPDRSKPSVKGKEVSRARAFFDKEDGGAHKDDRPEKPSFKRTRSLLGRRNKLPTPEPRTETAHGSAPGTPPRAGSPGKRPMTPILKSFSNSSLSNLGFSGRRSTDVPPVPAAVDADKYRAVGTAPVKKRDELWSTFRSLDGDASKFLSKAISQRPAIVRTTLLPFLRNYAKHPSNHSLRAEDLDRRATILNRWWSGLLDMLSVKNYQHVSGSDRPYILDSILAIMERPEWRAYPSVFCPLTERLQMSALSSDEPRPAPTAEAPDFVLESVHHNVRNIFVQNIFAQLIFVTDKMSLRTTPVSLVAFGGKTCAYAFFFCPGIADILLRLWDIKPQNIQRILRANGMRRGSRLPDLSDTVSINFPQCMRHLAFSSLKSLSQSLKETPKPPIGVENVQWHGHWVTRWSGGDSDLFYVFVKNFHLLVSDFLPPNASREEKLSAPGVLLVHAQLLNNLDTTIHRGTLQSAADGGSDNPVTFESLLAADDAATTVHTPPANAARLMGENRLILLLRDVLSVKGPPTLLFAESFCNILKAAAESTSLYNHDSCFTLCDLLQESIPLLVHFDSSLSPDQRLFDWHFWLKVFKQMVASQSTTTEVRLYALLFTIWGDLTANETSKSQLCLGFLLEQGQFHRTFNHWCPMVRAYYMRLLCWRLARYDGEVSEVGLNILSTLLDRLRDVWSHHKYLVAQAELEGLLRPSTAPCNPAPGRKLLIIRTDSPISSSFMMDNLTLSGSSSESNRPDSPPLDTSADTIAGSFLERLTSSLESIDTPKKRGSLFRSLLGYKSTDSPGQSDSPKPASDEASSPKDSSSSSRDSSPERIHGSRSSMYEQRPQLAPPKGPSGPSKTPVKPFTQAFFRFSLEAVDRRPHNLPSDIFLDPPRLPLGAQMLLQSYEDFELDAEASKPLGDAALESRYAGRSLAEWTWVVNECQNFFERRRKEGVPSDRQVETPTLGVETFRKPS